MNGESRKNINRRSMKNAYIQGGTANYGQVAGILMTDSSIPRIPGDPGHAETFNFPVRYRVVKDFPFSDLIDIKKENLVKVIKAAIELQDEGVNFIAADCGLFSPFQRDIANALEIPFIGSSLSLIPLIQTFLPYKKKIGIITGDTKILKEEHLAAVGANPRNLVIAGLDNCDEFQRVVVNRGNVLEPEALKVCVIDATRALFKITDDPIGAIILECTNLISFRHYIQTMFKTPVFDMVSLIEFFASGYRLRHFKSNFLYTNRKPL